MAEAPIPSQAEVMAPRTETPKAPSAPDVSAPNRADPIKKAAMENDTNPHKMVTDIAEGKFMGPPSNTDINAPSISQEVRDIKTGATNVDAELQDLMDGRIPAGPIETSGGTLPSLPPQDRIDAAADLDKLNHEAAGLNTAEATILEPSGNAVMQGAKVTEVSPTVAEAVGVTIQPAVTRAEAVNSVPPPTEPARAVPRNADSAVTPAESAITTPNESSLSSTEEPREIASEAIWTDEDENPANLNTEQPGSEPRMSLSDRLKILEGRSATTSESGAKPNSVQELLRLTLDKGTEALQQRHDRKAMDRAELKAGINVLKESLKEAGKAALEGVKDITLKIRSGVDTLHKVGAGLKDENVREAIGEFVISRIEESKLAAKDKVVEIRDSSKDQARAIIEKGQDSIRGLGRSAREHLKASVVKGKELGGKVGHGISEYFQTRAENTFLRITAGVDRLNARVNEASAQDKAFRSESLDRKADKLFQRAEKISAASGKLKNEAIGSRENAAKLRGGATTLREIRTSKRTAGKVEAAPVAQRVA